MEAKPNLNQNSSFYFKIGLAVSILISIVAFEWKTYYDFSIVDLPLTKETFEEMIEIPLIEEKQPEPKAVSIFSPGTEIIESKNEPVFVYNDSATTTIIKESDTVITSIIPVLPEPDPEPTEPVIIADYLAEYKGGMNEFKKYVKDNLNTGNFNKHVTEGGKAFVEFVVEKDGTVSNVKVLKGIHPKFDTEAAKVVLNAPGWLPAKNAGRPVRFKMVLPIEYKVQ